MPMINSAYTTSVKLNWLHTKTMQSVFAAQRL